MSVNVVPTPVLGSKFEERAKELPQQAGAHHIPKQPAPSATTSSATTEPGTSTGTTTQSSATTMGPAPFCGDGMIMAPFEECDDGNSEDGDGCNSDCVASAKLLWSDADRMVFWLASNQNDPRAVVVDARTGVERGVTTPLRDDGGSPRRGAARAPRSGPSTGPDLFSFS